MNTKKVLKIIGRVVLIILAAALVFTLVTFIVHSEKSSQELALL